MGRCGPAPAEGTVLAGTGVVLVPQPAVQPVCNPIHFFQCGACKCKLPIGGVCRFQDSTDKSSTAHLKHHAPGCWGKEAVDAAFGGRESKSPSKSIFAAFARKGQQPVQHTHQSHTKAAENLTREEYIDIYKDRVSSPSPS